MIRKTLFALALVVVALLTAHDPRNISLAGAVTVVRRRTAVTGNRKIKTFTITGGSGDTLDTRLKTIEGKAVGGGTNAPTAMAESTVGGYTTLTFTSGGAYTAIKITLIGN